LGFVVGFIHCWVVIEGIRYFRLSGVSVLRGFVALVVGTTLAAGRGGCFIRFRCFLTKCFTISDFEAEVSFLAQGLLPSPP